MSHIFDALERETGIVIDHGVADVQRVWQHITGHTPAKPYDSTQATTTPGATMTLDEIRTDIQNGAQTVITKAEEALAEAKTFAEQHVGALNALEQSPVAKVLEGFVLPPQAEQFIADMVASLAAKYGTAKTADAPAEPAAA